MNFNFQHDCIGVFDSGIGGLTVANAVSGLLPKENLLYIADNANAPYGSKPPAEVQKYAHRLAQKLIQAGAKLILVACNTATAMAIDQLRATWPDMPFVGIEPAIKPAAAATRTGVIGVMATQITLGSERYKDLTGRFAHELRVIEDPCIGLVPLIEEGIQDERITDKLHRILDPMLEGGADTLVLGCTHYPLVIAHIRAICGAEVHIINPVAPTAQQVARLLNEPARKIPTLQTDATVEVASDPRYDFLATGSAAPLQRALLHLADLNKHRALVGRVDLQ
ncbi:MAG: glutamate racemase [Bacteroidota bacterium]